MQSLPFILSHNNDLNKHSISQLGCKTDKHIPDPFKDSNNFYNLGGLQVLTLKRTDSVWKGRKVLEEGAEL